MLVAFSVTCVNLEIACYLVGNHASGNRASRVSIKRSMALPDFIMKWPIG